MASQAISSVFIWRRVHSLMGLWLVLYLIEHLIVNSQAALWLGDDGIGFIRMVDLIQSLPYLQVIETLLIGVPLVVHGVWGIRRALMAKSNVWLSDGSRPSLHYDRNWFFTLQRMASWILLFGIAGHVVQMRFLDKPKEIWVENERRYVGHVSWDEGLTTLTPRLGVSVEGSGGEVTVSCPNSGTALLLMVRDTFKSPLFAVLYTLFVLAAAFHAFNGFWTFLITWGAILSYRSQRAMISVSIVGIVLLAVLGLLAIWCSYWVNLRA